MPLIIEKESLLNFSESTMVSAHLMKIYGTLILKKLCHEFVLPVKACNISAWLTSVFPPWLSVNVR